MISIAKFKLILIISFTFLYPLFSGTTGKIAGELTDKETGEPLIGANVVVQNTHFGAATDLNGQYTILYIPPGTYTVEISYIGYETVNITEVRINIDQTTRLDIELTQETLETGAIIVVAERDFIKKDVSTSVISITDEEMKVLPVSSIDGVVGLQAGIQGGLTIRGGGNTSVLFLMDGVTLRDPRTNQPATKLALSAVKEVSVERGGFNAEYGQVRSGLVNVVTNEGNKNKYDVSVQLRYKPPAPKYQKVAGVRDLHDPYSFALRPFFDPEVAWTGTNNGTWDKYMRSQYPTFDGWNKVSQALNTDNDPDNDLTPLGAQRAFMYEIRKKQPNDLADYDIDAGFGGPVPFISKELGDLRFFTSFRSTRDVLLFPLSRPDYKDWDWTLKLNSDISSSMNLKFSALTGKQYTIRHNWDSYQWGFFYPHWPHEIAGVASGLNGVNDYLGLFSDYNFPLSDIGHQSYSLKFTNQISTNTFYEVSFETFQRDYHTRPKALRDTSVTREILPGYVVDSNPFGYWPENTQGVIIIGGSGVALRRDFTKVNSYTLKGDFTSQINFNNLLKTGFEVTYNDLNFDFGDIEFGSSGRYANRVQRRDNPLRAAVYTQNKLEVEGLTVNAGLRLDYSDANTNWYNVEFNDKDFFSSTYDESNDFPTKDTKAQWQLSPRLGISHPITEKSKLYFNYGHFKQLPDYESMFRLSRGSNNAINTLGDPNITLAKTVSYELGFDYLAVDEYLINIAAFYRDITDQRAYITYESKTKGYNFAYTSSNNYEDVKGVEFTLRKSYGRWLTGFANYTYQVNTSGYFGSQQQFDNPVDQNDYDKRTVNNYQQRPIPRPYARVNLTFFTPEDFGPLLVGDHWLGKWSMNVLFDWQAGDWVTYSEGGINIPGLANNVQTIDYYNTNLRLSKTFNFEALEARLFIDINNVFDTKRLWDTGNLDYRRSLHLPEHEAYDNITGNDKIGDYRKPGVAYQPLEKVSGLVAVEDNSRAIYYIDSNQPVYMEVDGELVDYNHRYLQRIDGQLVEVSDKRIKKILKDKAYIDMPNADTFWFLNPRNIFYGIRISYSF
jgi:outer membrane receptor protein involved in Fe transport